LKVSRAQFGFEVDDPLVVQHEADASAVGLLQIRVLVFLLFGPPVELAEGTGDIIFLFFLRFLEHSVNNKFLFFLDAPEVLLLHFAHTLFEELYRGVGQFAIFLVVSSLDEVDEELRSQEFAEEVIVFLHQFVLQIKIEVEDVGGCCVLLFGRR